MYTGVWKVPCRRSLWTSVGMMWMIGNSTTNILGLRRREQVSKISREKGMRECILLSPQDAVGVIPGGALKVKSTYVASLLRSLFYLRGMSEGGDLSERKKEVREGSNCDRTAGSIPW